MSVRKKNTDFFPYFRVFNIHIEVRTVVVPRVYLLHCVKNNHFKRQQYWCNLYDDENNHFIIIL